jgi:hypothetical protein
MKQSKLTIGVWALFLFAIGNLIPGNGADVEADLKQNDPENISRYCLGYNSDKIYHN